jgi:hypothetical protein
LKLNADQERIPVTPERFRHLAETADFAAEFLRPTQPSIARRFAECADTARRMALELERAQHFEALRARLADVKAELNSGVPL